MQFDVDGALRDAKSRRLGGRIPQASAEVCTMESGVMGGGRHGFDRKRRLLLQGTLAEGLVLAGCAAAGSTRTAGAAHVLATVATGLAVPVAMVVLPDGDLIVAQRRAAVLTRVSTDGARVHEIGSPGRVYTDDDAGLLDVALDPDPGSDGRLVLAYSRREAGRTMLVVEGARLDGATLREREVLAMLDVPGGDGFHFGGRVALRGGYLFVSVGDRHQPGRAQDMASLPGKVLRLHADGGVPRDNPWAAVAGARPEIWAAGLRNPQGMAFDSGGGLWVTDHGPRGGDELNHVEPGSNLGWPLATWGFAYEGGPVGDGTPTREGMTEPVHVWSPAIAPSDLLHYEGAAFPAWRGSFFCGALAARCLVRMVIHEGRTLLEERLLTQERMRVRCVRSDGQGRLVVGADDGRIVRVSPESS
jgi:glucose/arabinose dehydrogenase